LAQPPSSRTVSVVSAQVEVSPEERKVQMKTELRCFATLLVIIFVEGWNDGTPGPMLPAMQRHYHIGFAVVSLIFVFNCVGFILGAISNIYISKKLGFGKVILLGATFQLLGYVLQAPAPPFPVFALAYVLLGFGISIQLAQAIVFVVNLRNGAMKMGIYQATYGIGALVAPLVATQFSEMEKWSYFFFISLGLALINVITIYASFGSERIETLLTRIGRPPQESAAMHGNQYRQILGLRIVHVLAFFILAYVGVEVTIGGWIVTFVRDKRGGGVSAGYLSTGFFGGLALGRIALLWVTQKLGERRSIWLYIFCSIGLEITVWLIPSLLENAVAVALIGVFLGPIYPIVMRVTGRLIPYSLVGGSVGWVTGFGQTGSAILPFITGTFASKFGVQSLQPLIVTVMGMMVGIWALVPPDIRRQD